MNQDVFKHIHCLLSQLETQQAETQQTETQQEAHKILSKLKTQFINVCNLMVENNSVV